MSENSQDQQPEAPDPDPAETLILVRRAQEGDDAAFTDLYGRHAERVRRSVALRLGKGPGSGAHDLDDLVQETFLYAFEGIKAGRFRELPSEGGFRNWLATIAVNKIRDRARAKGALKRGSGRERLMRDAFRSTYGDPGLASPLARPSQIAQGREFEVQLASAVQQLDDKHRQILDLRDHCEMSYEEIAVEMGYQKAATMRSLYKRAKARLKAVLAEQGIEVE